MTKRECKRIAQKIAVYEIQMKIAANVDEKIKIEKKIEDLCSEAKDMRDMMMIDEYVQEILSSS